MDDLRDYLDESGPPLRWTPLVVFLTVIVLSRILLWLLVLVGSIT